MKNGDPEKHVDNKLSAFSEQIKTIALISKFVYESLKIFCCHNKHKLWVPVSLC